MVWEYFEITNRFGEGDVQARLRFFGDAPLLMWDFFFGVWPGRKRRHTIATIQSIEKRTVERGMGSQGRGPRNTQSYSEYYAIYTFRIDDFTHQNELRVFPNKNTLKAQDRVAIRYSPHSFPPSESITREPLSQSQALEQEITPEKIRQLGVPATATISTTYIKQVGYGWVYGVLFKYSDTAGKQWNNTTWFQESPELSKGSEIAISYLPDQPQESAIAQVKTSTQE